ncbi:MAG: amidohydrolase, partial [Neglectibacter timonensis]
MKTLYQNGTILPMDQERTAEALLVEDSRITACGSCSEVAPLADGADLVDLHGAALMPAFIDGH